MSNIFEGITPETTVSLGFLLTALTAAVAVLSFLLNAIRRAWNEQRKATSALATNVSELKNSVEIRMLAIENRIDGGVSAKVLQRWIQTLQRDNKGLVVPVMEFWDGPTDA